MERFFSFQNTVKHCLLWTWTTASNGWYGWSFQNDRSHGFKRSLPNIWIPINVAEYSLILMNVITCLVRGPLRRLGFLRCQNQHLQLCSRCMTCGPDYSYKIQPDFGGREVFMVLRASLQLNNSTISWSIPFVLSSQNVNDLTFLFHIGLWGCSTVKFEQAFAPVGLMALIMQLPRPSKLWFYITQSLTSSCIKQCNAFRTPNVLRPAAVSEAGHSTLSFPNRWSPTSSS